jgi:hypothetical protein
MFSNSYWDGRNGRPFSGGNFTDYQMGQRDGGYAQPGTNPIMLVIFLLVLLPAAAAAAISAILIAFILRGYVLPAGDATNTLSYRRAYAISFRTALAYELFSAVIFIILYLLAMNKVNIPLLTDATLGTPSVGKMMLVMAIYCMLPSLLIAATVFRNRLSMYDQFAGFKGYTRALVTMLVLFLPVMIVANYAVASIVMSLFAK